MKLENDTFGLVLRMRQMVYCSIDLTLHYSHPLLGDFKSIEIDQLISMIHFLVKREDEPTKEVRVMPQVYLQDTRAQYVV